MTESTDSRTTKEAVIVAATECFEQNGIRNTSLADVANKVGVDLEQVKSLFGSKNLLAMAVQAKALEDVKREYLANMPDASLEEMIKFIIRNRCDFVAKNVERTTLFFHKALEGVEPWSQMLDEMVWQLSVEFASLFEKSACQGEIRRDADINTAVRSLTSFYLTGVIYMGLREEQFETDAVWNFVEPQINLLLEGIRK